MTAPRITDDDQGNITAEIATRVIRSWEYADRKEQMLKMRMAHEFAEGWFQAAKACGAPEPNLDQFEGM